MIAFVDVCPITALAPDNQITAPLVTGGDGVVAEVPVEPIAASAADQAIATTVTVEQVVAGAAIEAIVSAAAVEAIAAGAAADDIIAAERADRVVAAQAADEVLPRCPDETVVAGGSLDCAATPGEPLRRSPRPPEPGCATVTQTAA